MIPERRFPQINAKRAGPQECTHGLESLSPWKKPNELLVGREYEGKKSKPEWGVNLSLKNKPILDKYEFENQVMKL